MDHDSIRKNGWRQGQLFRQSDARALAETVGLSIAENALLVLVSHDCDIVHSGDSEPYVYACVAEPISGEQPDGSRCHGKNSRFLQLPVLVGKDVAYYEIHAALLVRIDRNTLQTLEPHDSCALNAEATDILSHWLANRFERAAFPDTFNERIRSARSKILDRFKKQGEHLTAVFLTVNPDTELTSNENYRVNLVGVMRASEFADDPTRIKVSEAIGRVAASLKKCKGIDVLNHEILPETGVSLEDLRYLKRWDLDYLSLREGDDLPPR